MKLLAGDVGGTKTLLQIVDLDGDGVVKEERFVSASYPTFDDLLRAFLGAEAPHIDAACFAVAGPVIDQRAEITNLHWVMESPELQRAFDIPRVALINDFYAVALGVPLLAPADRLVINRGIRNDHAPIGILGAGTGLGEAILIWSGTQWSVIPTEGGHADFAPQDELQTRLFLHLRDRYGHVSWERLVSGMGLGNIYTFLGGDDVPAAAVAFRAAEGEARASEAFDIFVDIYGAEAGNMALRVLARGGIYLAGGVAAKNPARFTDGRFLRAFVRKGRFTALLEEIPVELITDEKVGLHGALEMARRMVVAPASSRP
jgi:glucokinase